MKPGEFKQKLPVVWAIVLTGIILTGCSAAPGSELDLVNNEQQREKAFDQILENQELLNKFMNRMMNDPQSMQWMMSHRGFMEHMFDEDNLGYMMDHHRGMDSYMMENMLDMMDSDSSLYRQWYDMMDEHHMMEGYHHMRH